MIYKLQAQAGSCRRSCGVTPRTISGMPSSSEQDDWGACTLFGTVPLLPPARVDGYGVARPCLAAVIEGTTNRTVPAAHDAYGCVSDLSRSFTFPANASACMRNMDLNQQVSPIGRYGNADVTLSGQRSSRMAPYGAHRGLEASMVYPASAELQSASHWSRNLGNQGAVEVRPHRPRQNKPAVRCEYPDDVGACQQWHSAGADRQGTLTITGSNVRLGTEMPVALSLFFT
jgi:hypothetical protein